MLNCHGIGKQPFGEPAWHGASCCVLLPTSGNVALMRGLFCVMHMQAICSRLCLEGAGLFILDPSVIGIEQWFPNF